MCVPRAPKVEQIPDRQAARLPDQGDPLVRESARRKKFAMQAMTLATQATLGAPNVTSNSSVFGA